MTIANTVQKRNLYHWFKHDNVFAANINEYIKHYPDTKRRIGSLPIDWLKNLPRDEFAHATEQVDTALHEFAKTVEENTFLPALSNNNDALRKHFAELSKNLIEALKQILKRDDIEIKYADEGGFKYCQKLTVGDYSYALSTFKPEKSEVGPFATHGQYIEPQKIFWVYKKAPHGRVAKPFMSRFCVSDEAGYGGYILSKFIDKEDEKRAKKPLNPYRERFYPLTNGDNYNHKNEINGVWIECGDIEENPDYKYIPDKEFWKNLLIFLDGMQTSWNHYSRRAEKFLLEQIDNGKDIFNMDLRTLESDDPLICREAIKMVQRLRTVNKLKTKLEAKGEFEQYLELINVFIGNYPYLLRFVYNGWF